MSVSRAVLRRFEGLLDREVTLIDGRKAILRVVDACAGKLSCCVEFPDSALVWVEPDELRILHEPGRSRGGAA